MLVKFPGQRAIGVHKNHICIPKARNSNLNQDVDVENPNELVDSAADLDTENLADEHGSLVDENGSDAL